MDLLDKKDMATDPEEAHEVVDSQSNVLIVGPTADLTVGLRSTIAGTTTITTTITTTTATTETTTATISGEAMATGTSHLEVMPLVADHKPGHRCTKASTTRADQAAIFRCLHPAPDLRTTAHDQAMLHRDVKAAEAHLATGTLVQGTSLG